MSSFVRRTPSIRYGLAGALVVCALGGLASSVLAQDTDGDHAIAAPHSTHYWRDFTLGAASSILAHEAGHVVTSLALGKTPSFGFDKGRPTVYSGINASLEPHKQFLFSSMGLNVQSALDESILDAPHHRGAAFERGVLAGGIGTAFFYITLGRSASNSDVTFMARTSSLSKNSVSLIYGGIAALHVVRMRHDSHYADFFVRPATDGKAGLRIGVDLADESRQ